jgi:hypothetical protein
MAKVRVTLSLDREVVGAGRGAAARDFRSLSGLVSALLRRYVCAERAERASQGKTKNPVRPADIG